MDWKTGWRALAAALLLFQCVMAQHSDLSSAGLNESVMWEESPAVKQQITSRATSTMTEGSLASGITMMIVLIAAASALKMRSLKRVARRLKRRAR